MIDKALESVLNEKDVENYYRSFLVKSFGDLVFSSPYGCDGYGVSQKHKLNLITEFKYGLDLSLRTNQIKVLCQAIYYVKKFEISGKYLPNIIFVGDEDECFAIHTNNIFNYLGMDFDWSIAPSNAHTNLVLFNMMMEDKKINPFIFLSEGANYCIDKINELNSGIKRLVPITPHNIVEVFAHFEKKVIGTHKLDTNQLANLFTQILINPEQNYLHPIKRRKTVVTKAFGEINLKSRESFESFFSHFSKDYSPRQKENLTAVVDRLIQDVTRRKQGEFFTPTIWVDKAHEYIASVFGDDWKEKYVVWDPAWGTGNLTRDYKFKELYCSTLIYADIETANQMGYNPEATKFQFDFLNHDYDYLPKKLREAIEGGREIIVLMNPPYQDGSELKKIKGESTMKNNIQSEINNEMIDNGWGKSSKQLFAQFFYRISKFQKLNNNINISVFCKPIYFSGENYKNFRNEFFYKFKYVKGFIFEASNFNDVSIGWGISFSIFQNGKNQNNFLHDVLKIESNYEIKKIYEKEIYNIDSKIPLSKWILEKNEKLFNELPEQKNFKNFNGKISKVPHNFLGVLTWQGNNVFGSQEFVTIFSGNGKLSGKGRIFINSENYSKLNCIFSSRKIIKGNWVNDKDEYMLPNEEHEFYIQYSNDSVIYSLFNNSSQQSSLRQVIYKDQLWDIKNQFFWMSKSEMVEMANQNNYTELYNDARTDEDRYVYKLLFGEERIYDQISPEAKNVLDSATNLVRLSFGMRRNFADDNNHLNSWDAGYAQLKLLWKEYYPEQFKQFREQYKVLEEKMRPMVYELGFLLK